MPQIHDGHRARMRQRLEREGLDSFEPHEVLELLLYYTIPLRNVNPLAHQLIQHFGSLPGVLRAPRQQLMQVPGVGESTAEWLSSLLPVLSAYGALRLQDRPLLDRFNKVADFGVRLFSQIGDEQLWVVNLNMSGHLLHSAKLTDGGLGQRLDTRPVLDFALRYHAQAVVVLQRRLAARMTPNDGDIEFTRNLNELLSSIGVHLMDNVMICGHRRTGFRDQGILRLEPSQDGLQEDGFSDLVLHWLD